MPSGTWVLRGGDLPPASSQKNLRDVHEAYGIWGICVNAEPGATVEEAGQNVRFGTKLMMHALSEELAEEGWAVVREPGREWPDALLTFTRGEPDSEEWDRLRDHMRQRGLHPNPRYRGK